MKEKFTLLWEGLYIYIGTHQRSFERHHDPGPYGLPFLEIGGLQLSYPALLSQERVKLMLKLRTSNLASTFVGGSNLADATSKMAVSDRV